MKIPSSEHGENMLCTENSKQFLYTTCSPHVLQKKSFWQRFACTTLQLFFGQASLVHPVGLVCITRENCSTQSKSLFPDVTLCSYASWWSTLKECQTLFFLFKRSWTQSGLDIEQQHFSSGLLLSIVSIVEFKAKSIQVANFYSNCQFNGINLWPVNRLVHFCGR